MARGVPHSDETRAAVLAALLAGQSVNAIADQYHLSESTVRGIRDGQVAREGVRAKREHLGDLVETYLREGLTTLAVQGVFFRDTRWISRQPASDMAVLHGVIADKVFRILAALQAEADTADPQVPDDGDI